MNRVKLYVMPKLREAISLPYACNIVDDLEYVLLYVTANQRIRTFGILFTILILMKLMTMNVSPNLDFLKMTFTI